MVTVRLCKRHIGYSETQSLAIHKRCIFCSLCLILGGNISYNGSISWVYNRNDVSRFGIGDWCPSHVYNTCHSCPIVFAYCLMLLSDVVPTVQLIITKNLIMVFGVGTVYVFVASTVIIFRDLAKGRCYTCSLVLFNLLTIKITIL